MTKFSLFVVSILLFSACLRTPEAEQTFLAEIYYPELSARLAGLSEENKANNWINIIDFGDKVAYEAGHIDFAENVEFRLLVDDAGHVINNGRVIKENFDDQWPCVIYSSSNDTIAYYIAKLVQALGYPKVYFYEGGIKDWQEVNGDYLCMSYNAFKTWYDQFYPFEDTLKALVDMQPESWFSGTEKLAGHIPGAINIPLEQLADTSGGVISLLNDGAALSEAVPDLSAMLLLYYSEGEDQRAKSFIKAAMELGYQQLFLFKNGYNEWISKGNPLSVD